VAVDDERSGRAPLEDLAAVPDDHPLERGQGPIRQQNTGIRLKQRRSGRERHERKPPTGLGLVENLEIRPLGPQSHGMLLHPAAEVEASGGPEDRVTGALLELAPHRQRLHGHPHVPALAVREAEDAGAPVAAAPVVPQPEPFQHHHVATGLRQRCGRGRTHDPGSDDHDMRPTHGRILRAGEMARIVTFSGGR
jgi:hypothetical protein